MTILVTLIKGHICDGCQKQFNHKPIRWCVIKDQDNGYSGFHLCSEKCKKQAIIEIATYRLKESKKWQ